MQYVGEKEAIIWGLMKWAKEWSDSTEPKYIDCDKKKGCKQLRKKYTFLHGIKSKLGKETSLLTRNTLRVKNAVIQ